MTKKVNDVFGMSPGILEDSYVDRGGLDAEIRKLLVRRTHIALRGESKAGKSWLRQRLVPDALTVQCRLGKSALDVYVDALSQLGVALEIQRTLNHGIRGSAKAQTTFGTALLAKIGVSAEIAADRNSGTTAAPVGQDVSNLKFVADLIRESGRRLVIEDFHYLSVAERKAFAFDIKALWDYGVFVVVIGVWTETNLLLELNPDLSGRVEEVPITWSDDELKEILRKGGLALNIEFDSNFLSEAAHDSFGNAGILQVLIVKALDELAIDQAYESKTLIKNIAAFQGAAMQYAEQLNPLYQQFGKRVSSGIRTRQDSTGIYSHAIAVIVEAPDQKLIKGLSLDEIFKSAHSRESRIQKGNLRTVLERFDALQVDADGRGLVVSYNPGSAEVTIVDKQLLLYRKYATVRWPWEDLIRECADDRHFEGNG